MCLRWGFKQQTACVPMMMVSRMVEQDWVQLASDWKNATLDRNKNEKRATREALVKAITKIKQRKEQKTKAWRLKFKCEYTIKIT
jgi:hypothetical protein